MKNEKVNKIEDILSSLDSIKKASAPDYFYTRLKAKMEKPYQENSPRSWALRPAFVIAGLFAIMLINTAVLIRNGNTNNINISEMDQMQSIASEYSLNDNLYEITQETR